MEEEKIKSSTLSRIFDDMHKNELKLTSIDTKMDGIIEFKDMMHKVIFGNGNPGIKGKLDTVCSHIAKLWGLMLLLMTAVITAAVVVILIGK